MRRLGHALAILVLLGLVAGFGTCGGAGAWTGLRTLLQADARSAAWGGLLVAAGAAGLLIAWAAWRQARAHWRALQAVGP